MHGMRIAYLRNCLTRFHIKTKDDFLARRSRIYKFYLRHARFASEDVFHLTPVSLSLGTSSSPLGQVVLTERFVKFIHQQTPGRRAATHVSSIINSTTGARRGAQAWRNAPLFIRNDAQCLVWPVPDSLCACDTYPYTDIWLYICINVIYTYAFGVANEAT